MGRKNKYETNVRPYLAKILSWRRDGVTIKQIADTLNVNRTVFYRYRKKYDELDTILEEAETQLYVDIVNTAENSLKSKLEDRMVTVEQFVEEYKDGQGNVIKTHKVSRKKLIQADTTALIFTMKNRKPEVWDTDAHKINEKRIAKIDTDIDNSAGDQKAEILKRLQSYSDDD